MGISTSTIANYELGVTKNIPPDMVVMMADLYRAPELKNYYCKYECPIGGDMPMATETDGLQGATLRVLDSLDEESVRDIKKQLLTIAKDGDISQEERKTFNEIIGKLETLMSAISELRMLAEK